MPARFAIIVPVGTGADEGARAARLLASLGRHESEVGWVVLVDDDMSERNLTSAVKVPESCTLVVLSNPRNGKGVGHLGGLFVGIMRGLQWIAENTTASFVLKLDTDSLVISPFADYIHRELSGNSKIGLMGVQGRTCNRRDSTFGFEHQQVSPLVRMDEMWRDNMLRCGNDVQKLELLATADETLGWLTGFSQVQSITADAIKNGYKYLTYCQGGAYVVSIESINLMYEKGYFKCYDSWKYFPIGEDVIMGMYIFSVNMQIADRSERNHPFGLHWKGLPFEPEKLLKDGYSIIHSVKKDPYFSEEFLIEYFTSSAPV